MEKEFTGPRSHKGSTTLSLKGKAMQYKGMDLAECLMKKEQPRRLPVNTAVGLTAVCVVNRLRAAMYRFRIPRGARDFSFF